MKLIKYVLLQNIFIFVFHLIFYVCGIVLMLLIYPISF